MKTQLQLTESLCICFALDYSDSSVLFLELVLVSFPVALTFNFSKVLVYFIGQVTLPSGCGSQGN